VNELLVTIGDIGVSQHTVITPSGSCPVREANWMFTDLSRTVQRIRSGRSSAR